MLKKKTTKTGIQIWKTLILRLIWKYLLDNNAHGAELVDPLVDPVLWINAI